MYENLPSFNDISGHYNMKKLQVMIVKVNTSTKYLLGNVSKIASQSTNDIVNIFIGLPAFV